MTTEDTNVNTTKAPVSNKQKFAILAITTLLGAVLEVATQNAVSKMSAKFKKTNVIDTTATEA